MYFIYNECIVTKILWVSVFVWSSSADRHFNIVAPRPLICPHIHAKNPPSNLYGDDDDGSEFEDDGVGDDGHAGDDDDDDLSRKCFQ